MKSAVCLAALFAGHDAFAGSENYKARQQPPHVTATISRPYQVSLRNLRAGILKCMPAEPILSGQVYPDFKLAELEVYQVNINVSFVAAFELRDIEGSTQLKAWAPKPSFGSGYSFLAAASVKLAELGDKSDCAELGF